MVDKHNTHIRVSDRANMSVVARPFTNNIMDEAPQARVRKPKAKRKPKPKLTAQQRYERQVKAYMGVYFPQTTVLPTMWTPEAMRLQENASEIRDSGMVRTYIRYVLQLPDLSMSDIEGFKVGRAVEGGAWCVQAGCRLFTFHHWLQRAQGACTGDAHRTHREKMPDYQRVTMEVLDKLMDLCMDYDMKTGKFPKFE